MLSLWENAAKNSKFSGKFRGEERGFLRHFLQVFHPPRMKEHFSYYPLQSPNGSEESWRDLHWQEKCHMLCAQTDRKVVFLLLSE